MPSSVSVWRCTLSLPNSFAPTDGLEVLTTGIGTRRDAATDEACHTAFATLLCRDASQVVLRPKHWKIPLGDLMAEVNGIMLREDQALLVHTRSRLGGAIGDAMTAADRDEAVSHLLRLCLLTHGGSFSLAGIRRRLLRQQLDGRLRVYRQLDGLLHKAELKPFVEQHPEFQWEPLGEKGMLVTLANAPGSANVSSEDLPELHAYLTGGAPTGAVALTSAAGTANAPGSVSVTSDDLAELHAHLSGGAPAGAAAPTSATGTEDAPGSASVKVLVDGLHHRAQLLTIEPTLG